MERLGLSVDDRDVSLRCYLGNAYAIPERMEDAMRLPAVRKAADLFDASVIDVQDLPASTPDSPPQMTTKESNDV